mgnify:CR=1 FL=1
MIIDTTKLFNNMTTKINIDNQVIIPKELLRNSLIDELKDISIKGNLILDEENQFVLSGNISGVMILKDDITLEPVDYKFDTDIEETIDALDKNLDITDILWQNIVVEIPSKVRKNDEDIELSGDGWRVITEDTFLEERKEHSLQSYCKWTSKMS